MTRTFTLRPREYGMRLLALLTASLWFAPLAGTAAAQAENPTIAISSVDSQAFPALTAHLTVTGANGLPLVGLTATDFVVLEDGHTVPAGNVSLDSDTSQPLTLLLAVDLAMPAEQLLAVQTALRDYTDQMSPQDQVAVVTFAEEVVEVQDFTSDQVALATAIGGLAPSGNATVFNLAAETAVNRMAALPAGRKAVLLFTDSGDTQNTLSPEPILNKAAAAGVALYPFGFGPRVNATVLENWARFSGGQAYLMSSPAEVQSNLQTLAVLLRQSYRLHYTSGLPADNARHNLTLQLDYQGQWAAAESRFVAVPGEVKVEGLTIANGQTLRGMVFLIAEVSAPAPVESVTFSLDGETLVELASPPYRFDWDTATAGAGTHAVTVSARDAVGNVGQVQVSVNVAVPPPVAATAAPVPTAVPQVSPVVGFARSALNVGRIALAALALLGTALVALLLWLRARELEAPKTITGVHLEVVNRGNIRTRYELRAEDPAKLMKFDFLVNEASLATRQAAVTYSPAAATQTAPAAGLAPAAATNGKSKTEKKETKGGAIQVPGMVKKAQSTAFKGVGVAAQISSWFMAVTYLIPGPLRMKLRGQTAAFRSDIDMVDDAAKMPTIYKNIVEDVVDVPIVKDKVGGAKPRAAKGQAVAMQPATALATVPAGAAVTTMVATGPAVATAAAQPVTMQQMKANTAGWAVTPYVEPGGSVAVRLHITPRRVPKSQTYGFRVLSRAADGSDQNKLTQIEHGSVALSTGAWWRPVISWVLFAVMVAATAGLVWFLLNTFGVVG